LLIEDMSWDMNIALLKNAHIGRIACVGGLQPYVTPFSFAYENNFIYSFGTVGKKIEWMRANPLVCIEVENIVNREEWQTVIVLGRFEELPNVPEFSKAIDKAHGLLAESAVWWEPGFVKTLNKEGERSLKPVWFRVSVLEITGHQGVSDRPVVRPESPLTTARHTVGRYLRAWALALE
jgi:nitroimidazol reductase NimA-like FMN-containing flavoprotein (pyridoxamine 5'-phosphate oxidase superfamily)